MVDVVIAFFLLGIFASLVGSNLKLPEGLYQTLSIFLMLAIGLKGGVALADHANGTVVLQSLVVIAIGLFLPLIAFPVLRFVGELPRDDCASIAAHYGSVSVGTYAVAIAVLESQQIAYEAYFPLFVVLLEAPAIVVGMLLARSKEPGHQEGKIGKVFHEALFNQGIVLMAGGLVIGFIYGNHAQSIMPLFKDLFHGMLALFLLQMGLVAGAKLKENLHSGLFIISFAIFMPLVGALIGGLSAWLLGLSIGGIILLAVLAASASYIAVPAAMTIALPKANHGLSITASLAITFPFNILVGIPLYVGVVQWFANA